VRQDFSVAIVSRRVHADGETWQRNDVGGEFLFCFGECEMPGKTAGKD
jgi:hypothetical protein